MPSTRRKPPRGRCDLIVRNHDVPFPVPSAGVLILQGGLWTRSYFLPGRHYQSTTGNTVRVNPPLHPAGMANVAPKELAAGLFVR